VTLRWSNRCFSFQMRWQPVFHRPEISRDRGATCGLDRCKGIESVFDGMPKGEGNLSEGRPEQSAWAGVDPNRKRSESKVGARSRVCLEPTEDKDNIVQPWGLTRRMAYDRLQILAFQTA